MQSSQASKKPRIYDFAKHQIDQGLIDPDALFVVKRLRETGYSAYLVGGSVRDLLLKKTPKDYDISTSARPEEVKKVFGRSCLLIGKRFRLAHVRFGHKIMEVSTFRSGENENDLIVHDNKWGTEEEDVIRRDFTINGLFLDPHSMEVIDYVGGWEDLQEHTLRTIGDPMIRFKQDPVRMIRLLKFQARFGFKANDNCIKALRKCSHDITKSAPARVLEEFFRMLESGASAPFFKLMADTGLLELIFPGLNHFLQGPYGVEVLEFLEKADEYNKKDLKRPLDRGVLTACLIYPILEREIETQFLDRDHLPHIGEILHLTDAMVDGVVISSFSHFPKRISSIASFVVSSQYRMTPLSGKKHHRSKLMQNKEFLLALQFLKIRSQVNQELEEDYRSWRNAHHLLEHPGSEHRHQTPHSPRQRNHGQRQADVKPQ
ncbi:MAG: polynucleotide adenylyltransferase PcnB [Parachlamydiales bacterium]|jgi:poly(A) polymerase